jgi:hypothetical protein
MVLRGGAGIFYDPMIGYVSTAASSNPPQQNAFTIAGNNLSPGEKTNLFEDTAAANAGFVSGFTAGKTLAQIQATDPNFVPPGLTAFQKQMHFPEYQKWSLELQQGVGTQSVVSIGYFGHRGLHELVENHSANAYCNPAASMLPNGVSNPCFGFTSSLPLTMPDPRFGGVTEMTSAAASNYHGVVVSFRHRSSRWSQGLFQLNYSYSRTFDEVSNGGPTSRRSPPLWSSL